MADKRILILGGGTSGLSTTSRLTRGYNNVIVLEKTDLIPSHDPAGDNRFGVLSIAGLWVNHIIEGRQSYEGWQWKKKASSEDYIS